MAMMTKKHSYDLDNRKILIYSYIYKVEDFFRNYNDKFFGAKLINFYGCDEIPLVRSYSVEEENICNKNIVRSQGLDSNLHILPFVKFNISYNADYISNDAINFRYARTITLLLNDIKTASYEHISLAHEEFVRFKKQFLKFNNQNEDEFLNSTQPNNKDNLAFSYIKRLEELFGVNRYNIEMPERIYKYIFKKYPPIIPGIEFERKIRYKTTGAEKNNGIKQEVSYYCIINYYDILSSSTKNLKEYHYALTYFIKESLKLYEEYVDERKRKPYGIKYKPKKRGLNVV